MKQQHTLYRLYNADGDLLYIGITLNPFKRISEHKRTKEWFDEVANIRLERFPTLAAVAAAEIEAIRTEKPRENITYNNSSVTVEKARLAEAKKSERTFRKWRGFTPEFFEGRPGIAMAYRPRGEKRKACAGRVIHVNVKDAVIFINPYDYPTRNYLDFSSDASRISRQTGLSISDYLDTKGAEVAGLVRVKVNEISAIIKANTTPIDPHGHPLDRLFPGDGGTADMESVKAQYEDWLRSCEPSEEIS